MNPLQKTRIYFGVRIAIATLLSVLIWGCAGTPDTQRRADAAGANSTPVNHCQGAYNYTKFLAENSGGTVAGNAIKIVSTGYGAPPKTYYPDYQRRLMALRASRIDAYRSMAESINGIRILGSTTIGDMIVEVDSSRAFVDGFVRGARTITVMEHPDGSYETSLETYIDEKFFNVALSHRLMAECGELDRSDAIALREREDKSGFYYAD
ncbi:MAG: hypothetical protein OEY67_10510 [Gammaproteobacteria bacterium]|nr:hypothetical protein [Gammaproteobacteria bacterium]